MALGPLGLIDLDNPPLHIADPIIELAERYLIVPTGMGAGKPIQLTDEQVEFFIAWYSVTPNGRRFVYNRKGIVRMAKGWAKSPIGAIDMFAGLVGEVVPDGLDAHGSPVSRPHPSPWLQVAATSEDQTDNLYRQLFEMLRDSDAVTDFHLDVGITRIQFVDRPGWIEPVTSSSGAREGQPLSGAALEETHLWRVSNGGRALAATITRNAVKMGVRTLELTNAPIPGAGSVAERSEDAVAKGRGGGVLLVKREAVWPDDHRDPKKVRKALAGVYGSAALDRGGWVDLDRITQEIVEAAEDEIGEKKRFYGNLSEGDEESPVQLSVWAEMANVDLHLVAGDTIALGFDGSEVGDATALYACRWPDWLIVPLGVWEMPTDDQGHKVKDWRVKRLEVLERIRWACTTFRVVRGYADDSGWQSEIDELNGEFGQSFTRFPHRINARIGPACERFSSMAAERTLRHDGDPTLARHLANCRKVQIGGEGSPWWRPARRTEGQPIDAVSAAVSAVHALGDAVAHGEVAEPPKRPAPWVLVE